MGLAELQRIKEQRNEPKIKKTYTIPKVSKKRVKQIEEQKKRDAEAKLNVTGEKSQWEWFLSIRPLMTGVCEHCGGKTCKDDNNRFHYSIAHILPKNLFPSVAKHPLNRIELCFWGNSCHSNMDNKTLDIMQLNCFSVVIDRFVAMYPDIDNKEKKYIPDVLLQYINVFI